MSDQPSTSRDPIFSPSSALKGWNFTCSSTMIKVTYNKPAKDPPVNWVERLDNFVYPRGKSQIIDLGPKPLDYAERIYDRKLETPDGRSFCRIIESRPTLIRGLLTRQEMSGAERQFSGKESTASKDKAAVKKKKPDPTCSTIGKRPGTPWPFAEEDLELGKEATVSSERYQSPPLENGPPHITKESCIKTANDTAAPRSSNIAGTPLKSRKLSSSSSNSNPSTSSESSGEDDLLLLPSKTRRVKTSRDELLSRFVPSPPPLEKGYAIATTSTKGSNKKSRAKKRKGTGKKAEEDEVGPALKKGRTSISGRRSSTSSVISQCGCRKRRHGDPCAEFI